MSQLNAATSQVNTLTSSGSTISIPKNISVTARYIINNSPIPVISIRPKERKHLTGPTTAF